MPQEMATTRAKLNHRASRAGPHYTVHGRVVAELLPSGLNRPLWFAVYSPTKSPTRFKLPALPHRQRRGPNPYFLGLHLNASSLRLAM